MYSQNARMMIGLVLVISTGLIFYALYREVQNIKYDIQSLKTHASDNIKNEDDSRHEDQEDQEILERKESEDDDDEIYNSPFDLTRQDIDISFFQNLIPSIEPKHTLTSITEINEEEDPVLTDPVIEPIEEITDLVEICDQSSPKKIKSKGKKSKKNILA